MICKRWMWCVFCEMNAKKGKVNASSCFLPLTTLIERVHVTHEKFPPTQHKLVSVLDRGLTWNHKIQGDNDGTRRGPLDSRCGQRSRTNEKGTQNHCWLHPGVLLNVIFPWIVSKRFDGVFDALVQRWSVFDAVLRRTPTRKQSCWTALGVIWNGFEQPLSSEFKRCENRLVEVIWTGENSFSRLNRIWRNSLVRRRIAHKMCLLTLTQSYGSSFSHVKSQLERWILRQEMNGTNSTFTK